MQFKIFGDALYVCMRYKWTWNANNISYLGGRGNQYLLR